MKNDINKLVEDALESFDHIMRATPGHYLFKPRIL